MKLRSIPLDTFVDLEGDSVMDPDCPGLGCVWRSQVAQIVDSEPSGDPDWLQVTFASAGANEEEIETT